jgi:hypothetical protein
MVGCSGGADADLDAMQPAVWQASAWVKDDQPDALLRRAMATFNHASTRMIFVMDKAVPIDRQAANTRWTALRGDLLALLNSPLGQKLVVRLNQSPKASRYIELHTAFLDGSSLTAQSDQ